LHLTQGNTTSAFSLVNEVADVFDLVVASAVGSRLSCIYANRVCQLLPFMSPWDVLAAPVDQVLVKHVVVYVVASSSNMAERLRPSCGISTRQTANSRSRSSTCPAPSDCMAANRCLACVDTILLRSSGGVGVASGYLQLYNISAKLQVLAWIGGILSCLDFLLFSAAWVHDLIDVSVVAVCVCWTSTFVSCLDSGASSWTSKLGSGATLAPLVPVSIH
jgi:hypothetical protein